MGRHPGNYGISRVISVDLVTLTPRERAVAEAAATGISAREIADQLYLSPRTVESHLGAMYRKLGVTKRTELVALLAGASAMSGATRSDGADTAGASRLPFPAGLIVGSNFVGRGTELAAIEAAFDASRAQGPVTVMIGGPAGVGKTTLVANAIRRAWDRGAAVLAARCAPDFGAPFQPLADALRPYLFSADLDALGAAVPGLGVLAALLPELAGRLPDAAPISEPASARRHLVDIVIATLSVRAQQGPTVLIFEDLHWADVATVAFLRQIVSSPGPAGLMVVGTFRDTDVARSHPLPSLLADVWRVPLATRLQLRGLSAPETVELARLGGDPSIDAAAATRLHARADGNPFFVLQLLQHSHGVDDPLPAGVSEVIYAQAARLGEDTIKVLETAAVLGASFDAEALLGAVGPDPDPDHQQRPTAVMSRLEATVDAGLVDATDGQPDRYTFRHDLVRETLLGGLSAGRLGELHHRAGHAFLGTYDDLDPYLTALAGHFAASTDRRDWPLALEYAARAAHQALERHAPDEALLLVAAGLDAMPEGERADEYRFELLLIRTDAYAVLMDLDAHYDAVMAAAAVARDLHSPSALGRALMRNTLVSAMGTLDEELLALKREAIAGLEPGDPLRVNLLVSASYQRTIGGHGWAAATEARQAVTEARMADEPASLAAALHGLAAATVGQPDITAQLGVAEELVELGAGRDDLPFEYDGRRFRGVARLAAGDRAGFESDEVAIDETGRRRGAVFLQSLAAEWRALLALADADLPRAEELADKVLAVAGNEPNFLLGWLAKTAIVHAEQDRAVEILPTVESTVEEYPALAAIRALASWLFARRG